MAFKEGTKEYQQDEVQKCIVTLYTQNDYNLGTGNALVGKLRIQKMKTKSLTVNRCSQKPCPKTTSKDAFMDDAFDSFQLSEGCWKVVLWKKGSITETHRVQEQSTTNKFSSTFGGKKKLEWVDKTKKVPVDKTMDDKRVDGLANSFSETVALSDPNLDSGFEDDVFRMDIYPKAVCEEPQIGKGCK